MTTTTPSQTAIPGRTLWWNRTAVSLGFFLHGVAFANWAARIPDIQIALGLSEARLGLALLGTSVGVLTSLTLAGGLIHRLGSRTVAIGGGMLFSVMLLGLGLANSFWTLFGALALFGLAAGLNDMGINTQGVEIERRFGRSVMTSMHALFSFGVAFGAFISGFVAGQPVLLHFSVATTAMVLAWVAILPGFVREERQPTAEKAPAFALPPRALWLLGLVGFCGAVAEGGLIDWTTKYMRDVVAVEGATAAYGLTVFSLMMTVGRLSGDWAVTRLGRVQVVRVSGLLGATGIGLAAVTPSLPFVFIGLGLAGLGLATVIPLVFSVGGNVPGIPSGVGIAGVATLAYGAFLVGPPMIGTVAELISLRASFAILAVLLLLMASLAGALRQPSP